MNESEYRQMQDDYNSRRLKDHKRQEEEEFDRLNKDSMRLDWLLYNPAGLQFLVENGSRISRVQIDDEIEARRAYVAKLK